jgi:hypothetical protein
MLKNRYKYELRRTKASVAIIHALFAVYKAITNMFFVSR